MHEKFIEELLIIEKESLKKNVNKKKVIDDVLKLLERMWENDSEKS